LSEQSAPATGKPYGVALTCKMLGVPRSSFYVHRGRAEVAEANVVSTKRGPKPKVSDDSLLALIREDLEASPFRGEGHRKVWARLRVLKEVRVSKTRVLRIMRENNLLSPHRVRQGVPQAHEGTIVTETPGLMWGTDGAKVFTLEDGWVWVFSAVEHWNAECMGWHVCKYGSRFAALEPISMGLHRAYGSVAEEVARGLALRMDHGSQYLSDHFQNQIKYWGIAPSFAFVEQPQTNGVAERFNRTLKEQAIHGRIFNNLEEVRHAVERFVEIYNTEWRLEKLGYLTPIEARAEHLENQAA
jgi:putative transposase